MKTIKTMNFDIIEHGIINKNKKLEKPIYEGETEFPKPSLPKTSTECPDCKDRGMVKEKNGQVHTCWRCLASGKLDVHSKNLPESDVKI